MPNSLRLVALALISTAAVSGPALAADCPAAGSGNVAVINNPTWLKSPDAEDMTRYYPGMALREHKSDQTFMDCAITADGRLDGCKVLKDEHPKEGFERGAIGLAKTYRMAPPSTLTAYTSLPDCVKQLGPPHVVVHVFWTAGG